MRGAHPVDRARRLVDQAEFELDSIKELMAHSKSLDRTGSAKPPPLPLMSLSPPVSASRPAQPTTAGEIPETLAGRLALIDAS